MLSPLITDREDTSEQQRCLVQAATARDRERQRERQMGRERRQHDPMLEMQIQGDTRREKKEREKNPKQRDNQIPRDRKGETETERQRDVETERVEAKETQPDIEKTVSLHS